MTSRTRQTSARQLWLIVPLLLATACSPPDITKIGGYVLVYQLDAGEDSDIQAMTEAVGRRVGASGVRGAKVRQLDDDKIEIALPGIDAQRLERIKGYITAEGILEFRVLAKLGVDDLIIEASRQITDKPEDPDSPSGRWVRADPDDIDTTNDVQRQTEAGEVEVLVVQDGLHLNGSHLATVRAAFDERKSPAIDGSLTAKGATVMKQLTSANLPNVNTGASRRLGILLDGQLISAPRIQSVIESRFMITGNFTQDEVDFLVNVLRTGQLPGKLKPEPVSTTKVEPVE